MAGGRALEFGVFDQTPRKWLLLRASPFVSFGAFARKHNPNVGSALRARLSSVANAPGADFSPFRCPPRGLGRAALDSDHAECVSSTE